MKCVNCGVTMTSGCLLGMRLHGGPMPATCGPDCAGEYDGHSRRSRVPEVEKWVWGAVPDSVPGRPATISGLPPDLAVL